MKFLFILLIIGAGGESLEESLNYIIKNYLSKLIIIIVFFIYSGEELDDVQE